MKICATCVIVALTFISTQASLLLNDAKDADINSSDNNLHNGRKAYVSEKVSKKMKVTKGTKSTKACKKGSFKSGKASKSGFFNRVSSFLVCSQIEPNCNTDTRTGAEIVAVSGDGMTLVYSNNERGAIGFVDISDPSKPSGLGELELGGEPTSVAVLRGYALTVVNTAENFVNTSGVLLAIDMETREEVNRWPLGGQPDSLTVSPDGNYVAIAIENERDEDLGNGNPPQLPAGFVVVFDTSNADHSMWTSDVVTLTGLDGVRFPSDPEPEYISINADNVAVVTLQENNALVLIDLKSATVTQSFTAGFANLTKIDTVEDEIITLTNSLENIPREPDGVAWIGTEFFATADEGDLDGGSRGFTIFDPEGNIIYTSGNEMDHVAAMIGHYPEVRSENAGNEPENVYFKMFGEDKLLFVNSERSSVIFVYDVKNVAKPELVQILPTGTGPEGTTSIPSRNLLITASEVDARFGKIRSLIHIYERNNCIAEYPTLISQDTSSGPIPWGALSSLAASVTEDSVLYSTHDKFYKKNRIFKIDTSNHPAVITNAIQIKDTNGKFGAILASINSTKYPHIDATKFINDDKTVNIDAEGIATTEDGYFVVSHEGSGDFASSIKSLNYILKVDPNGNIESVAGLPEEINEIQQDHGFEGITYSQGYFVVAFQREWADNADGQVRIGLFKPGDTEWSAGTWKFLLYPLDEPTSQNGGWVGVSDIAANKNTGEFLVLERDNQGGPDAAIKKIYSIDIGNLASVMEGTLLTKTLVRDILGDLLEPGGPVLPKVEGVALASNGDVWIVNDNDGVDFSSGETQLINLGDVLSLF